MCFWLNRKSVRQLLTFLHLSTGGISSDVIDVLNGNPNDGFSRRQGGSSLSHRRRLHWQQTRSRLVESAASSAPWSSLHRTNVSAGTQRWHGAQSDDEELPDLKQMECSFRVPLKAEIGQMPIRGASQAHYIYCDMHHNDWHWHWQDSPNAFAQFVPQLMRGDVVSSSDQAYPYCIAGEFLDHWYIQAQYIWETRDSSMDQQCDGDSIRGYVGDKIKVDPGDQLITKIYYRSSDAHDGNNTNNGWVLQIAVRGHTNKVSQIIVDAPFMGTNANYPWSYSDAHNDKNNSKVPIHVRNLYSSFTMGNLCEAWNMNERKFYPARLDWSVRYCTATTTTTTTAATTVSMESSAAVHHHRHVRADVPDPPSCQEHSAPDIWFHEQNACEYTDTNPRTGCSENVRTILDSKIDQQMSDVKDSRPLKFHVFRRRRRQRQRKRENENKLVMHKK